MVLPKVVDSNHFLITTLTWGTHEKLGYKQSQVKNMCSVGIFPEI